MSYLYNGSEVKCLPYLIIKPDVPSGARELTHNLLFSCIPVFPCDKGQEEKLHISLHPYPTVLTLCQRGLQGPGVSRICMPGSLTCPMSKCMILLQCLSIFARHRWKKKKKIPSCIPRRRLEAIHLPHKARGREEETFLRLRSFLGQHSQYSFISFFKLENPA